MTPAKKFWAIAAAALVALPLSACVNEQAAETGGQTEGGDGVTIGIKFDQPGLGLREGENYTGFDVEVARYVAGELGYSEDQITFVESPSAQRETLLSSGQVDMIFATYSITDTRKEQVSFAGPYIIAGQDLLVRADDTEITGPETLSGKTLCSVTGSTPAEKVKEEYPDVELQEYANYSQCVQALSSGGVDAVTTDNTILAGFAAQEQYAGQLKVVGKTFSEERYGVGIPKGDVQLCEDINAALTSMVDSGEWQAALDETLGASGFQVDTSVNPPEFDTCS
ncbi:transporter substrate-binding domain-containing protein [Auraticoccus sp. F435]|uniref:Transporter substrate-binding domain-containing protein n=1 Tax=Auraticoccus cholistanensis TaxID=2656650 RepID=A0A6A9UVS3_9ACTN|nr:glutamate ABC transporter substrate-binding protein [Auraticoccus cholistanensis]MVA75664.1 transporter substrate-binding domain-containing protein [Auraticoccus cholistanensis]